jgi:predicted nucleotidyltransferase component of viral defense system
MGGDRMMLSREKLFAEAARTGFRSDVLEKVVRLIGLLETIQRHPFLKGKLALKGGTALNVFHFNLPRLSVDIDLNYVGAVDREAMLEERPKVDQALRAVFQREDFSIRRMPEEHAGGKWLLRYASASGQGGNLEVDVNYMYRLPLFPLRLCDSHPVGAWMAEAIPLVDIHELAAGKLTALMVRQQARDLFDSVHLLRLPDIDTKLLRIAFVVYGAMNRKDWRTVTVRDIDFDPAELTRLLLPTLRGVNLTRASDGEAYGKELVADCSMLMSQLLPFSEPERRFLELLLDRGIIDASMLTEDRELLERIERQPLLAWKAAHVRRHRGLH